MKLKNIFICILIFTLNIISYAESSIPKVEYKKIEVNSLEDIKKWKDSDELYVFTKINIDLSKLSPLKKKDTFVDILLPSIKVVNAEIENNRNIAKTLSQKTTLSEEEKKYAENLFKKYRVEYGDWEKLYSRLIIYPTSLILTQGAIERVVGVLLDSLKREIIYLVCGLLIQMSQEYLLKELEKTDLFLI